MENGKNGGQAFLPELTGFGACYASLRLCTRTHTRTVCTVHTLTRITVSVSHLKYKTICIRNYPIPKSFQLPNPFFRGGPRPPPRAARRAGGGGQFREPGRNRRRTKGSVEVGRASIRGRILPDGCKKKRISCRSHYPGETGRNFPEAGKFFFCREKICDLLPRTRGGNDNFKNGFVVACGEPPRRRPQQKGEFFKTGGASNPFMDGGPARFIWRLSPNAGSPTGPLQRSLRLHSPPAPQKNSGKYCSAVPEDAETDGHDAFRSVLEQSLSIVE